MELRKKGSVLTFCIVLAHLYAPIQAGTVDLTDLQDESSTVRMAAYDRIIAVTDSSIRHETIRDLIEHLRSDKHNRSLHGDLHLALRALGVLKADEAIPSMLSYFTFVPDTPDSCFFVRELTPTQYYYPTVLAFTKIGRPTLSFMDSLMIDREETDEAKRLAAFVVMEVVGKDTAIVRIRELENRSETAKLATGEKLTDYLHTYKITFHHPHHPPDEQKLDSLSHQKREE